MGYRTLISRLRAVIVSSLVAMLGVAACGGSSGSPTTTAPVTTAPVTTTPAGPAVIVSPQFIHGVIPGAELRLLVSPADPDGGPVTITADAPDALVTVSPGQISGTEVAEVSIVPEPVADETELTITIIATPPGPTAALQRTVTVVPWEDDRREQAAEVLALFTGWLDEHHPELGIGPETGFNGTFVAPMLLVVSHYGYFNDDWELGLSWHVMIPPDDFAELYLRPRHEPAPTHAFRIGSWQSALQSGIVEVAEIEPPPEVVR